MALVTKTKRRTPVAHKKRIGQHHAKNQRYLKHYWPYLPMLLVVGLAIVANSMWSHAAVLGAQADFSSQTLLAKTNQNRLANNIATLTLNQQLTAAAQAKASDMVNNNYWSHTSPGGTTPWDVITASGYQYSTAGENLAYGFSDASSTEKAWMNSAEHRANITNTHYQEVGFGVVHAPNYLGKGFATIVVAEYGSATGPVANITFDVNNPAVAPKQQVLGSSAAHELHSQPIARIQLLSGSGVSWSYVAAAILASSALTIFVIRHGYRLHKVINRGEMFVATHAMIDCLFLALFVLGYLLTRTAGIIH